jgi:hypothetical protein
MTSYPVSGSDVNSLGGMCCLECSESLILSAISFAFLVLSVIGYHETSV